MFFTTLAKEYDKNFLFRCIKNSHNLFRHFEDRSKMTTFLTNIRWKIKRNILSFGSFSVKEFRNLNRRRTIWAEIHFSFLIFEKKIYSSSFQNSIIIIIFECEGPAQKKHQLLNCKLLEPNFKTILMVLIAAQWPRSFPPCSMLQFLNLDYQELKLGTIWHLLQLQRRISLQSRAQLWLSILWVPQKWKPNRL